MINPSDKLQYPYQFIDIHYHADPDLYQRKHDAMETGRLYKQLQGAVVLKSHLGSTSVQATLAQREGLAVFPSIVLNHIAGGIDHRAVLRALAEYQPLIPSKLLVHLPTITGRKHQSKLKRELSHPYLKDYLNQPEIILENGRLKSNVMDILKLAKDYPIVISTGHASKEEVFTLADACAALSIPLMLNQPANPLTGLNAKELLALTNSYSNIWIEQTALTYILGYQSEEDFKDVLINLPRVIYSSDLGQTHQLSITEWIDKSKQWFKAFSLSQQRMTEICLTNPRLLLDIHCE